MNNYAFVHKRITYDKVGMKVQIFGIIMHIQILACVRKSFEASIIHCCTNIISISHNNIVKYGIESPGFVFIHVVLSRLYQEKMVTVQEVDRFKPATCPWRLLVQIQYTKRPAMVTRTSKLVAEVQQDEESSLLKGQ